MQKVYGQQCLIRVLFCVKADGVLFAVGGGQKKVLAWFGTGYEYESVSPQVLGGAGVVPPKVQLAFPVATLAFASTGRLHQE